MRGTPLLHVLACVGAGIIPAYAGNTSVPVVGTWLGGDHPRVCGEHSTCSMLTGLPVGSSPRMRGTHLLGFVCDYGSGIIPAYAGNTTQILQKPLINRDHPRVCGEHWTHN